MSKNMLNQLGALLMKWVRGWSTRVRSSEARRNVSNTDSVVLIQREGTMSKEMLNQFGALLMQRTRDWSIEQLNRVLRGKGTGTEEKKLGKLFKTLPTGEQDALEKLVLLAVDTTLHYFLWLIEDEPDLDLVMKTPDEVKSLRDESDGLSGEIYSIDGWIAQFSKHPSSEDFSVYQKYLKLF